MGSEASALIADLSRLLQHPLKYVRFFAADAVLTSASEADGDAMADAVMLIRDPEKAVRGKAMSLLAQASDGQLAAALPFVRDREVAAQLAWLLDSDVADNDVLAKLQGDQLDRVFAATWAARRGERGLRALQHAAMSRDAEVSEFASLELEIRTL